MFPKASDKTLEDKLNNNHMGKTANFVKPKKDPNAHFAVVHYAGTVAYNVTGWLEKNKDPVNESVIEQFRSGQNQLIANLFGDAEVNSKPKRSKGSTFQTVSALYRVSIHSYRIL